MKKIPLETTLVGAYRFLFTKIISIIGTIWFPTVLAIGAAAGLVYLVAPHAWLVGDFSHFKPEQVMTAPIWLARGAIMIVSAIAGSMILVGLMRHALGLKQSTTFIYFSLGAPVWRMLLACILGGLLLAVIVAALVLVLVLALKFGAPLVPHGYAVAGGIVLGVIVFCAVFYSAFRLFFFLPAVVVAENRIGLGRSWSLGGGNFWRMFFVYLLIVVPVGFIASVALEMTILPVVVTEAMKLPHKPEAKEIIAFLRSLLPLLPVVATVAILWGIALRGLMAGAIGSAYNAVTAKPAEEATSA
ncbi:MAG: glycerophosphoryl diester phosphodiesterase membrane domain-containing protein [Rhizomicrobium sp.]|jgi:hypothetical protein